MEIMAPNYDNAIQDLIEQGLPEFHTIIQTLFAASNPSMEQLVMMLDWQVLCKEQAPCMLYCGMSLVTRGEIFLIPLWFTQLLFIL